MADYDWFDNEEDTTKAEITAAKWRPLGLIAVHGPAHTMGGQALYIEHYRCRRGCGTLVWNPQEHIDNVCREWHPVAGQD